MRLKNTLSKLLFLIAIAFWVNCFADCNCPSEETRFVSCPKTYVTAEQIAFYENAIFVHVNDLVFQVEALSTDAKGIFFQTALNDGCGPSMWKCTRLLARGMPCNTCNWDWNYRCSYCKQDKK